jgi:hypothetical protein
MRTRTHFAEGEYHSLGPLEIVTRIVDFLFGLLYVALFVRLILVFVNAAGNAGFFEFIRGVTAPFFAPFQGIVAATTLYGGHRLEWSLVIAIVAYMLLHALIHAIIRIAARA